MPGMDGIETFYGMRNIYRDARVAMMTGFALETQLSGSFAQWCIGHTYETHPNKRTRLCVGTDK